MSQGKSIRMPVYLLADTKRPPPNFLVDGLPPHITTLYAWTSEKKAKEFAVKASLKDFQLITISSEQAFRGVLGTIVDCHPTVRWLHWDPSDTRRAPRRFAIKNLIPVHKESR